MYVPLLRHPALLLVAAAVVLTLGTILPQLAILVAQAASLGLLLALLARLLRRVLGRGYSGRPTVQGRSPFSDSRVQEIRPPRMDGSSKITAASTPVAVQTSAADSKS